MPTKKTDKNRLFVIAFAAVVLAGLALLFTRQVFQYGGLAFDILTYAVSIIALILAVLSVVNGLQQRRIINRMVRDVHAAVFELRDLVKTSDKIEKEIDAEYHMNKVITDVLAEHGIGDDEKARRTIARKVSRRMKKLGQK